MPTLGGQRLPTLHVSRGSFRVRIKVNTRGENLHYLRMHMNATLDTNVIGPLACPDLYPTCPDMQYVDVMRELVRTGKLTAYLSEASTSLEAISNVERVDMFLRQLATRKFPIQIPEPAPERKRVFSEAVSLGLKVLHAPRVALSTFIEFPETAWAQDVNFPLKERLNRYHKYIRSQPDTGVEKLKILGAELVTAHGLSTAHLSHLAALPSWPSAEQLMWMEGLLAEYDSPKRFTSRKKFLSEFRDTLAEWFDTDIQASHYAYGHQYLCTFDSASNAGASAIMHSSRRASNEAKFGLTIVSPRELLAAIQA